MLANAINQEAGMLEVDGFKLRYFIEGTGLDTLVVGSAFYYPRTFSQHLREKLRFIFMDHRGFGISPGSVENSKFELDVIINDIELMRKKLGLKKIIIVGHSGHAYMALEYAKKYPQHVSHVVMLGIVPNMSEESHQLIAQYWQESVCPKRKTAYENSLRQMPDEKLAEVSPGQRFIQQYIRNAAQIWYDYNYDSTSLWNDVEVNMDMFMYVWGKLFRELDITKDLASLNVPVFVGSGRYDYLAPPSLWTPEVRSQFKNLTVRVFEHSGHTPQLEEKTLFDNELLHWLSNEANKVMI